MDFESIREKFRRIGARVELAPPGYRQLPELAIDLRETPGRETFLLHPLEPDRVQLEVIDLRPRLRHLLLLHRTGGEKVKFLCGHDERHWFVAGIPGAATSVRSVETAFEALQPEEVHDRWSRASLPRKRRHRRRNAVFVRQGEWFFVPAPELDPAPLEVHHNEPLQRGAFPGRGGGGKPHVLEYSVRRGGETVYLAPQCEEPLTGAEYQALLRSRPEARRWPWTVQTAEPELYARGTVRHADHATIRLPGWHRVHLNTEPRASEGRGRVLYLD